MCIVMCYSQNHKSFWSFVLKYKGWLVTDTIKIQQNNFIEMLFTGRDHTTESCANLFLFSSSLETILKREAFKKRASIGEAINAVQGNVVRLVDTHSLTIGHVVKTEVRANIT